VAAFLEGELTSAALCWRLERSDGAGLGLTSHDGELTRDGASYQPTPGITPAAVTRSLGLEPHSGEIAGALTSEALDQSDLALGRWDGASVRLFAIDWTGADSSQVDLIAGELGGVSINGESFSAELSGAASALEGPVCPSTSPQCRAQFGDAHCRIDLAGRSQIASVVSTANGELTLDGPVDAKYLLGRLRYLSGANCGLTTSVIAITGATVRVRDLPRATVEAGCRIELREGCDKRFETCSERFANAVNFRGEPHLPGADLLTRYPGA
jgi:uncharacterized phage protein (TIGR02218 family)